MSLRPESHAADFSTLDSCLLPLPAMPQMPNVDFASEVQHALFGDEAASPSSGPKARPKFDGLSRAEIILVLNDVIAIYGDGLRKRKGQERLELVPVKVPVQVQAAIQAIGDDMLRTYVQTGGRTNPLPLKFVDRGSVVPWYAVLMAVREWLNKRAF